MKKRFLKVATVLLSVTLLASSCVGSFSLFNKLSAWNRDATGSKFLNELIFIVISPAYVVCSAADVLVLNSIEFWSGSNPVAAGKTMNVQGQDGRYYAVKTLKDGYEIKAPDGKITCFLYDKDNDSWSQQEDGKTVEIFRFNDDGTIQVNLGEKKMDITADEMGLNEVAAATGYGFLYAAR